MTGSHEEEFAARFYRYFYQKVVNELGYKPLRSVEAKETEDTLIVGPIVIDGYTIKIEEGRSRPEWMIVHADDMSVVHLVEGNFYDPEYDWLSPPKTPAQRTKLRLLLPA